MALKFGTSGLRGLVVEMTDLECYVNTRGFLKFLFEKNEIKEGSTVAVAGDLRSSTPRILRAVFQAIRDFNCKIDFCGKIPTPTLTYYAMQNNMPSIMITGSHIPTDRNGIKYTKKKGEIMKEDEKDIIRCVKEERKEYSIFNEEGMFKEEIEDEEVNVLAKEMYIKRYLDFFEKDCLSGMKLVLFEHSAVGRDIIKEIFIRMGASIIYEERSDNFIPIDTEKVSGDLAEKLYEFAKKHKPFAILSTDGDSDRPLLTDEKGEFIPGDKLGVLACLHLKPKKVAIPISANNSVINFLRDNDIEVKQTRIGSPYVIEAMEDVGWEVNGGFLTQKDYGNLKALPTRDAVLPILCTLVSAREESLRVLVSKVFQGKYLSFSDADYIENTDKGCEEYNAEIGKKIVAKFKQYSGLLNNYFNQEIKAVDYTDGVRIYFSNNEVIHMRPSGNAPQFRWYVVGGSKERAAELIKGIKVVVPKIIKDFIN